MTGRTYADEICDELVRLNFTHCFFLAGGNTMHLLNSARTRFECVPMLHEVSAGIAAEYFNETSEDGSKAFALVTAGPGMTNIVTALAGAFTESRELLVIGGQVKSTDLARGSIRQRGIQEVDGVAIAAPITKMALRIESPIAAAEFRRSVSATWLGRPGPVFLEICLDAQGAQALNHPTDELESALSQNFDPSNIELITSDVLQKLIKAQRPIILIGGGLTRRASKSLLPRLAALGVPLATTYNGADRVPYDHDLYFGRPNTWGMRWSNLLIQQSDFVLAVGTRLGLQQTGFNWREFVPNGVLVQVDIDEAELLKGHPEVDQKICTDAARFLEKLLDEYEVQFSNRGENLDWQEWKQFGRNLREQLPLSEMSNRVRAGFVNHYEFVEGITQRLDCGDVIIPCSSGSSFTATYQSMCIKADQVVVSNKSLASMGYGLAGSIGASLANPKARIVLFEGDGGFIQNAQEIGTAVANNLNVKLFLFANNGYASIRTTQRNYFGGAYVGCDVDTGLGFPDWSLFFSSFGVTPVVLTGENLNFESVIASISTDGFQVFVVSIDPEQTYYPKIDSRITNSGNMESSPLHLMSPPLSPSQAEQFEIFLPRGSAK